MNDIVQVSRYIAPNMMELLNCLIFIKFTRAFSAVDIITIKKQ